MADGPPTMPDDGLSLALLGHDLRAALTEVLAGMQLVRQMVVDPELAEPIARCRAAGDALSRLIEQSMLVCLGKGSPGPTAPVVLTSAQFHEDLRLRWTGRARETGHHFQLEVAGTFPEKLHIDQTALERILANLIGNALCHTPPCDIGLTMKVSDNDLLLISVRDTGPGFPQAVLSGLQADFSLPENLRRPGGGFGLQSVKKLVDALGGRVNARNPATGGAEVGVCLPLATAPYRLAGVTCEDPAEPPRLPLPPDLTGLRVLIADDSPISRELVEVLARHVGASVTSVTDGAEAIAELRRAAPDVVILDEEMPGKSGLEVLEWLRGEPAPLNRVPVMMLTGHIDPEELSRLRAAGADMVTQKPILCPLELGRSVLATIGHHRTGKAAPPPDLSALRRLKDIAGREAMAELLRRLREDLENAQRGLRQAVAEADASAMRGHSHVIIALAGTAGATQLHEMAVALNGLAHSDAPGDALWSLGLRLADGLDRLLDAVRLEAEAN